MEYYFKIQYTKGIENIKAEVLSRKAKLQNNKKLLGVMLRKDNNGLIRYNYPKIVVIQEVQVYKLLESNQIIGQDIRRGNKTIVVRVRFLTTLL